jgi:hypothetical protein
LQALCRAASMLAAQHPGPQAQPVRTPGLAARRAARRTCVPAAAARSDAAHARRPPAPRAQQQGVGLPGLTKSVCAAQRTLQRVLARSSAAFAALAGGVTAALRLALLAGPDALALDALAAAACAPGAAAPSDGGEAGAVAAAARAALARCGAGALGDEVAALARSLAAVAALGEAVHADTYRALLADLL